MLCSHVVGAAEVLLQEKQYEKVTDLAKVIADRFIHFDPDAKISQLDKVQLYATEVLTLGFLWQIFVESIREGDGNRVMLCWKFLLLVFKAKKHTNYAKEAVILLSQCHCLLSDRLAKQLTWSRFVNTKGRGGCNISCDLHLEHLNRRLKGMISHLHSNIHNSAIDRAAKSLGKVYDLCKQFEEQSDLVPESDRHNKPSSSKDIRLIQELIKEQQLFQEILGLLYVFHHHLQPCQIMIQN